MTACLRADSVGKSYRLRRVLGSASLAAVPGTITLLLGRNGAGKSTLLEIASGSIAPDTGTVQLDGEAYARARLHELARKGVFYLRDRAIFSPSFTPRQHLCAVEARYGGSDAGSVGEVADGLGIAGLLDVLPGTLSGGERRRAEFALALVRSPRYLLADEPLRGVPPKAAELILAALRGLAARGCGIALTGHELSYLWPAADRVVWLTAGVTREFESPADAERDARFRTEFLMKVDAKRTGDVRSGAARSDRAGERLARPHNQLDDVRSGSDPISTTPGDALRMRIDRQTLQDLDIFGSAAGGHSLFDLLDHTGTTGGRARLRRHFRQPSSDASEITDTQRAVQFMLHHPTVFGTLPDEPMLKEVDRYLHSSFTTTPGSSAAGRLAGAAWHRLRYPDLFQALHRGVSVTVDLLRSMSSFVADLASVDAPARIWRLVDPITTLLEAPEVWRLGLDERARRISAADVLGFDHLLRERLGPSIEAIMEAVHELDALRSMALATAAHGLAFPSIVAEEDPAPDARPLLRIEGLFHPFVSDPVRNDFRLDDNRTLVFLTGPNMAGKTTYLKACALCVYFAHLGMGVPAARMELSPFDALFSSINTVDSVRLGYSYFFSEVRRIREAASLLAKGQRIFAVFDELFKGTNVRDAYDASGAVVSAFARCQTSIVLVASHLVELAEEFARLGSVQLRSFEADIRAGQPVYDYALRDGSSAQRLGMVLLESEGLLALLRRLDLQAGRA